MYAYKWRILHQFDYLLHVVLNDEMTTFDLSLCNVSDNMQILEVSVLN